MGLDFWFNWLLERINVFVEAPIVSIVAFVTSVGIGVLMAKFVYGERVSVLKERLGLKEDEVARYKRLTETQTPDEAAQRIAALELRVAWTVSNPVAA